MKNQKGLPRGEAGQTLIEILLALSISIIALTSIAIGVTTSLSNTQYSKNQGLANSYAQEGMGVVKQIRDSNWSDFSAKNQVNYCLAQNSTDLVFLSGQNCGQNVGIFSRDVKIEHSSADCANGVSIGSKVTVNVSWTDNKCGTPLCHKAQLITCLSNIDLKSTP